MEVRKLKSLTRNPVQPSKRCDQATEVKTLASNIERFGLEAPPVVDESGVIIDGHRRVAAMLLLGWTECVVIVSITKASPAQFASGQGSVRSQSTRMRLETWSLAALAGDGQQVLDAYDATTRKRIQWLVSVYGEVAIHEAISECASLNPTLAAGAMEIVSITNCEPLAVCRWMLETKPSLRMLRKERNRRRTALLIRKIKSREALSEAEWFG